MSLPEIEGFGQALRESPKELLRNLAKAYAEIGRYDIDTLRQNLGGKFNIRAKGLSKSFKYRATDPSRATDFGKIFVTEYTGWKAAKIFQTGGTISGKGKNLTILFEAARGISGRRRFTQAQLRQMITDGRVRLVPTPHGILIVQDVGGLTKTGKGRKNSRSIILGILRRSVTEKKRLEFFENFQRNEGFRNDLIETAVENTLVSIAAKKLK